MSKQKIKQFIVRKYVLAESAEQACKLERKYKAHDVWIDDEWKKEQIQGNKQLGFII